jgi:O-antigen ligase
MLGRAELYYVGKARVLLGTEVNPGAFAVHIGICIPLAFMFFVIARTLKAKMFYLFMILVFTFNLIGTLSRGAMVGVLAGLAAMVFLWLKKKGKNITPVFVILGIIIICLFTWWHFYPENSPSAFYDSGGVYSIKEKVASIEIRKSLYAANFFIFIDHPLLGVGYDRSRFFLPEYGFFYSLCPHNNLLGVASELGIVGFIPFVSILFIAIKWALAGMRRTKDTLLHSLLVGLFGAFVVIQVVGLTHLNYVSVAMWFLTGLLVKAAALARKEEVRGI